ncbi:mediator of RNA polymerase II transcription subunit 25 [Caerostris darwini]|uniref:Mediator of RNA polymerase II transcription subunit 25 n=1 Tax=Caerostris darwini TaxID=1538125 RepID=A0AAV4PJR2_9ARAC|nr:mediator of RNA polymerase II transcription subunit 25 [Caerostris darwini]
MESKLYENIFLHSSKMVVSDQSNWMADVVFVIEGTANMSPYIESLKSNYILPTLEYFNGSPPDDRDCGSDTNCTMYALVVFFAADCAPETASNCFHPTPSTHKFLTLLDNVKFIGGGAESHSHVAEGLSTALQAFDDFATLRENGVQTQKHCILICNSPPYPIPALESVSYQGLMTEQLAGVMMDIILLGLDWPSNESPVGSLPSQNQVVPSSIQKVQLLDSHL